MHKTDTLTAVLITVMLAFPMGVMTEKALTAEKRQDLVICTDTQGNMFINPKPNECQDFKELRYIER